MIIKVCGMRNPDNIKAVEQLGPDWMGFIFYAGSSRYVGEELSYLPEKVKRVGVFVNEEPEIVRKRVQRHRLDIIQLHGEESPVYCNDLKDDGFRVVKAFGIVTNLPFPSEAVQRYEGCCDYFLFDTQTNLHGGSGKKFNWEMLAAYKGETPFLLSGGISPEDVEEIKSFAHPRFAGIDINSRFEIGPAVKDIELIKTFIKEFR